MIYETPSLKLTDERIEAYDGSDEHGKYEKGDLTAPNRSDGESGQPWRGIDPGHRHWAPPRVGWGRYAEYIQQQFIPNYSEITGVHARLDALNEAGLIIWSGRGKPRLKRYLTLNAGMPPQSIWDDIGKLADASPIGMSATLPPSYLLLPTSFLCGICRWWF